MARKSPAQLDAEIAVALSKKKPHGSKPRGSSLTPVPDVVEEAAYAVFDRPGGEDLTRAEFHEEVLGLLRHGGSDTEKQIDALYKHIYGG